MPATATGVLEIALAEFRALQARELRHEQAVVIDQPQLSCALDDHVRRLDVAMRDTVPAQFTRNSPQRHAQLLEHIGVVPVRGNECRERLAVRPVHPHDRVGAAFGRDAGRLKFEVDEAGAADATQVAPDGGVSRLQRIGGLVEAADGVTPAVGHDLERQREIAAANDRLARPTRAEGAAAQQRVRQCDAQAQLQGVGVLRE